MRNSKQYHKKLHHLIENIF